MGALKRWLGELVELMALGFMIVLVVLTTLAILWVGVLVGVEIALMVL